MMTAASNQAMSFIGIDVSKFKLNFFDLDSGESLQLDNSEPAIKALCQDLKKKPQVMVVMEATGAYGTLLANQLASHNIPAAVVNPR